MKRAVFLTIIIISLALASCTSQEITGRVVGVQQAQDRTITSNPVNIQINPIDDGPPPGTPTVTNMAALKALSPGQHSQVWLEGYYTPQDGGQGLFQWDPSSTQNDNAGTIIIPDSNPSQGRWIRDTSSFNYYNVRWFGARGRDISQDNDYDKIISTIEYAMKTNNPRVYIPPGIYQMRRMINLDQTHSSLEIFGKIHYKKEDYYEGLIENAPRNIAFEFEKKDFRVVDETKSTVLKTQDSALKSLNSLYIIYIRPRAGVLEDLTIRDLALNGNKYNSDLWPEYSRSQRLLYIFYTESDSSANNINIENVAAYASLMTGFDFARTGTNNLKNLLAYDNEMHGIATRQITNKENVEAHGNGFAGFLNTFPGKNEGPGGYGVDFSGGSISTMKNFELHHNWAGMKSANSIKSHMINGSFANNFYHGYTTQQTDPEIEFELHMNNILSEDNGGIGVRISVGANITLGKIITRNNGKSNHYYETYSPNILIFAPVTAKKIVSEHYDTPGSYAVRLRSSGIQVEELIVHNSNKVGVEIAGDININSGHIYDNDNAGIYISGARTLTLQNVKFGSPDDPSPYRQTYREIYDGGSGTLYYKNLDFTDSKVSPENRIRVSNVNELP